MSGREINLDGGETSIIKALGFGSTEMTGDDLMTKLSGDLVPAELIDTIKGLMALGYVESDKSSFYNTDEFKAVHFRVNSGYGKDLREAISPQQKPKKSKRVRRE